MQWLVAALIDIIFTSLVAIGTSWYFVSRYLAKRGPDRLGKSDVRLLREMYSILVALKAQDDLTPLGVSDNLLARLNKAIESYANSKETPT